METAPAFTLRLATEADVPALHTLIEASVRGLQAGDYTQAQIEGALGTVLGLDTQLVRDQTYFVAEAVTPDDERGSGAEKAAEKLIPVRGTGSNVKGTGFSPYVNLPESKRALTPEGGFSSLSQRSPCFSTTSEGSHDLLLAGCGGWSKRKTLFGADRGPGREPELLDPATDAAKVRAIFVHPRFARRGLGSLILARVEAEAAAAGFRRYEMGSTLTGIPLYRLKGYIEVERICCAAG